MAFKSCQNLYCVFNRFFNHFLTRILTMASSSEKQELILKSYYSKIKTIKEMNPWVEMGEGRKKRKMHWIWKILKQRMKKNQKQRTFDTWNMFSSSEHGGKEQREWMPSVLSHGASSFSCLFCYAYHWIPTPKPAYTSNCQESTKLKRQWDSTILKLMNQFDNLRVILPASLVLCFVILGPKVRTANDWSYWHPNSFSRLSKNTILFGKVIYLFIGINKRIEDSEWLNLKTW